MEESHYHHHHHHHHGHHTTQSESESTDQHAETISGVSDQQAETLSRTSEQQQITTQSVRAPVLVPKPPNQQTSDGVQLTSSFHSVSSMDSSAEMAKYFPEAQTPSLSSYRHNLEDDDQQAQSVVTTTTAVTNSNMVNAGPYRSVAAPITVQQQFPQPAQASVITPQQHQFESSVASQLPPGIPSFSSQIEGLAVSQTIVNDVLIDLQSKVINETQQYYGDSSSGNYFEPLSPIYIRAPNPTIILRSDLHRLRAQLDAQPPVVTGHRGGINQFQRPSFPPPQK